MRENERINLTRDLNTIRRLLLDLRRVLDRIDGQADPDAICRAIDAHPDMDRRILSPILDHGIRVLGYKKTRDRRARELTAWDRKRVKAYIEKGFSAREIERDTGIPHATVSRWIKDNKLNNETQENPET